MEEYNEIIWGLSHGTSVSNLGLKAFSSAIRRTFVQYFTRFQLIARSRGTSATAGLLVFISEVALMEEGLSQENCLRLAL